MCGQATWLYSGESATEGVHCVSVWLSVGKGSAAATQGYHGPTASPGDLLWQ